MHFFHLPTFLFDFGSLLFSEFPCLFSCLVSILPSLARWCRSCVGQPNLISFHFFLLCFCDVLSFSQDFFDVQDPRRCFLALLPCLQCLLALGFLTTIFLSCTVRASYLLLLQVCGEKNANPGKNQGVNIPSMISSGQIFSILIRGHGRTRPSHPPLPWPRGAAGRPNRGPCRLTDAVVSGLGAALFKAQSQVEAQEKETKTNHLENNLNWSQTNYK